jgi:hypothetical protein
MTLRRDVLTRTGPETEMQDARDPTSAARPLMARQLQPPSDDLVAAL